MATLFKFAERNFEENPGKIDPFRIFTEVSRARKGVDPRYLNFDLRRLDPGQYSAPYHFHRYAEELFLILSGSATVRTPTGFEAVQSGDLLFFEAGETGAHQLHNPAQEPCVYLDVRSFIGYDVCEYPDSDKILLAPSFETFDKNAQLAYFAGEEKVREKWAEAEIRKNSGR